MALANDERLTISRLAPLIRRRKISPVEVTRWLLERIEKYQPVLNAYITVTRDLALRQARQAEREIHAGKYRGPLHGIPVCLKDLFHTRRIPTTAGSTILREFVPQEDAPVVERLRCAGAVLLGKTNLHEFAYGPTNLNPHYGPVRNPWNQGRMSGGSSGGTAAAVAAALSVAGLGSDTGGSIRIPAAACGCVGFKASYGAVPLRGVIPLATTLDHAGPLTRSVEDAALVFCAIAGFDPLDPTSAAGNRQLYVRSIRSSIRGLRVGIPKQYFFERLDPAVRRAVNAALRGLELAGARLADVQLTGMEETAGLAALITGAEALAFHEKWLAESPSSYGSDVVVRLESNRGITAVDYIHALERRRGYARRLESVLDKVDVLAAPTLPVEAPPLDAREVRAGSESEDVRLALLRMTRPGNLSGLPAVSLPCGFTPSGLPVGLQLIGRRFGEETVLRAAYAYEQSTDWHRMFPLAD